MVLFVSVSVIVEDEPLPVAREIPATDALVHTKVANELLLVAVYVLDTALHQLAVEALVIIAVGLTFAVTLNGVPAQPLTEGVTT